MMHCHICGAEAEELEQPGKPFQLVSSDGVPMEGEATFLLCGSCGTTQKAITPQWLERTEGIFYAYQHATGEHPRTARQIDLLSNFASVSGGRLLDIGCGSGHLLREFHGWYPKWKLSGAEYSEECPAAKTLALEAFFTSGDEYNGPYDVITLSHVLEHIPNPIAFLRGVIGHLASTGYMLIAVPNLATNPLDLVVADHCTHFTARTLAMVCEKAGFAIERIDARIVPRELTAILSTDYAKQPLVQLDRMRTRLGAIRSALEYAKWEKRSCT